MSRIRLLTIGVAVSVLSVGLITVITNVSHAEDFWGDHGIQWCMDCAAAQREMGCMWNCEGEHYQEWYCDDASYFTDNCWIACTSPPCGDK